MRRGLRIYPWLQEAKRRGHGVDHLSDCNQCQKDRSPTVRQHMGCGYEPVDPRIPVMAWDGQALGRVVQPDEIDENGKYLYPVCAGYVCGLPEFIEATHAHFFLTRGGLLQWTDGEPPTAAIKQAVVDLESEQSRVVEWASKNPHKA